MTGIHECRTPRTCTLVIAAGCPQGGRRTEFYLFFGVKPHVWMDIGLLMMFYALYYGVMARDVAEICTEKMVSGIGVSTMKIYTGSLTYYDS